jgi:hypothetical protein
MHEVSSLKANVPYPGEHVGSPAADLTNLAHEIVSGATAYLHVAVSGDLNRLEVSGAWPRA